MVAIHTLNGKECYCYIVAIIQGLNGGSEIPVFTSRGVEELFEIVFIIVFVSFSFLCFIKRLF